MKITAIIPAAGSGERYSKTDNKLLEELNGKPVIVHTLLRISGSEQINSIIVAASEDLLNVLPKTVKEYNIPKIEKIIKGGSSRQESVFLALKAVENQPDIVLIHDGARPLISDEILNKGIKTALSKGSAVCAVKVKDTIKRAGGSNMEITDTLDRDELWQIQTPQIFNYEDLLQAHEKFTGCNFTDDSALMERSGHKVFLYEGSYSNIKITTAEDLLTAKTFINFLPSCNPCVQKLFD